MFTTVNINYQWSRGINPQLPVLEEHEKLLRKKAMEYISRGILHEQVSGDMEIKLFVKFGSEANADPLTQSAAAPYVYYKGSWEASEKITQ